MLWTIQDAEIGEVAVNDFDGVFDADQAIFFARELEYIKAKSYDVLYAELPFRKVFPLSNEARPGTRFITYRTYDKVGMAKIIAAYADDLPRADIAGKETTVPVRDAGLSCGYTMAEIRAAALTGMPLDARRMSAVMRGHEQFFNVIAWNGDDEAGLIGLFNDPNLPIGTVVDGAAASALWADKTNDEILFDLNSVANDIFADSKMVERPNTLLLPPEKYAFIASTPRSSVSDTTILAYFLKNNPYVNEVIPINEMTGAGTAGVDVMMCYDKNPDKLQFEIPMEPIFHPEQRKNLEILIPSECSTGGLITYYPQSVRLREGF